jgi:hypothetical protein
LVEAAEVQMEVQVPLAAVAVEAEFHSRLFPRPYLVQQSLLRRVQAVLQGTPGEIQYLVRSYKPRVVLRLVWQLAEQAALGILVTGELAALRALHQRLLLKALD